MLLFHSMPKKKKKNHVLRIRLLPQRCLTDWCLWFLSIHKYILT